MIKIYGVCPSPFVRKALVCAELKGLEYERIDIMPGKIPDDFKAISPLKKIPAITDGDFTISDSSVICDYLEEKYPQIATAPSNPEDKARARWLEEFADTKLAETATNIFFERILRGVVMGHEPNEERVTNIVDELLPERLDYLETILPASGFMFGDDLFTVDVALTTHFINASYAGYAIDKSRWPVTAAYYNRVIEHPALQKRFDEEIAMMGTKPKAA
ncbi:Protein LigF [BD1-7 clade bacterium]|uniref:Protein LigF n=1 Tax=BD1-7 clade bacterium TaxID=2029982 RepID=A0A5S9NVC5_9GAMM|nr:Protein LigF [BD1-7 clade bacterium]CAA0095414.1 Protein LigF [BD1-7 clade bacterium]